MTPLQPQYTHIFDTVNRYHLNESVLGVAWDSAIADATVWGGECVRVTAQGYERVAHMLPYYLPGGDICTLEPRRSALGLLYACYGEAAFEMALPPMQAFTKPQLVVMRKMLSRKLDTPPTSHVGRLFDGVASLLNLHQFVSSRGQTMQALAAVAAQSPAKGNYPFTLVDAGSVAIDWRPMLQALIGDYSKGMLPPLMAAKFYNTLVRIVVKVAQQADCDHVVLAGRCFEDPVLTQRTVLQLKAAGFMTYGPAPLNSASDQTAV